MRQISVVIPTYNRANMIKAAVESVLAQEGQGEAFRLEEIWIIDDGSKDETEEVIKSICDERIYYYRTDQNRGAGHARNVGVQLSKSEWIAFQDSDDIWMTDKLKLQSEFLDKHKNCGLVTHPIRALFNDGRCLDTTIGDTKEQVECLATRNFVDTPTMLVRRELFLSLGGFDEKLKSLEDWDFALKYASDNPIGVVHKVLLEADMKTEGVSSNMANYYKSRCRMLVKHMEEFKKHHCEQKAMEDLLLRANEDGVLEQVGKMLEMYLTKGIEGDMQ